MPGPSSRIPNDFRKFTDSELAQMKKQVASVPRLASMFGSINQYAEACEYQVIQMMVHGNVWSGPVPPNPAPGVNGSVEFGLLPYWLNHPSNDLMKYIAKFWNFVVGSLPATQISAANYGNLLTTVSQQGLVAGDGTIYGESTYEALDPGWSFALYQYLVTYFSTTFAPFVVKNNVVSAVSKSQINIALVGDWGTGAYPNGPAQAVMNAIYKLQPDYIIHLGDVYYAGTAGEESDNLLAGWPQSYAGKSFTLNSNHEMYSGANGYFGALGNSIFSAQNGCSYFALQYGSPQQGGPWTILGLDSGYWSSYPLVMDGSIAEPASSEPGATAQTSFLQGLVKTGLSPESMIVLTHHNPISEDGSTIITDDLGNNLWAQVTGALGSAPAAWYWGHVHNGIIYPNPTATGGKFYGRCVGHGALPFGNAWGLQGLPKSQVRSYANTPNPSGPPLRMMNGFAMLAITASGQVTETFYLQDGAPAPWTVPFTYQLGRASRAERVPA